MDSTYIALYDSQQPSWIETSYLVFLRSINPFLKVKPRRSHVPVLVSCVIDARNQLVAQEAVRKPSTLRRPPARTGEAVSSKDTLRLWLYYTRAKVQCMFQFLIPDGKDICVLSSRLSQLQSNHSFDRQAELTGGEGLDTLIQITTIWYSNQAYCPHLFDVFSNQVQLYTAPASISQRHGKGPEASSLTGAVPAQGAPGEQGPAGR